MARSNWYELQDTSSVLSPSLLVYPKRILHNIRVMIEMAGGTKNLRPHIKTHKTAEIIEMQLELGIRKFKCATIAEAELLALCEAPDVLLAMQPVGVDMDRFFELMEKYPECKFSALADNLDTLNAFSKMVKSKRKIVSLWMDINTGMDRTGITPNENAIALYRRMDADPNIKACGLHTYDGHIRNTEVTERKKVCDEAFAAVTGLKRRLEVEGIRVKGIVAGGSPTFPFHARREGVEASPGTTLLWDAGYGSLFPDMEFLPAAVLLTRIISKPSYNVICLDLGHKHLASEMPFPRVKFLGVGNDDENVQNPTHKNQGDKQKEQTNVQKVQKTVQKGQSEEHFVLEVEDSEDFKIGAELYAIPMHICPTVAKYDTLQVVSGGQIIDDWKVAARNRRINI